MDDFKDDELFSGRQCLHMAVTKVHEEKSNMPTEEEFIDFQNQLGLPLPSNYDSVTLMSRKSHNIDHEKVIQEDDAECVSIMSFSRLTGSDHVVILKLI